MKDIAVRENHLYKKVYAQGKKAVGKYTVIYVLKDLKASKFRKANPLKVSINRLGLTVTKKMGKANKRNRIKRIIRAAYHDFQKEYVLKKGFLVIITARESSIDAKSSDILNEMKYQFEKIDMIEKEINAQDKDLLEE